jgi:hypothetical protein
MLVGTGRIIAAQRQTNRSIQAIIQSQSTPLTSECRTSPKLDDPFAKEKKKKKHGVIC